MRYYRLLLAFITLVAFACQMFHGHGLGSYTASNTVNQALSFCANTNLPKNTMDFSKTKTVEISCNNNISLFFLPIYFSWKPVEENYSKKAKILYKNIQEQVYIIALFKPPKKQARLV